VLCAIVLSSSLLSGAPPPITDTIPTVIAAQLDAANAAFSRAFVDGNGATMALSYTADAILHPPRGGIVTGGSRVADFWRPVRAGTKLGHRLEPTLRRMLAPDVVLEMGRWHDRPLVADTSEPPWVSGCYTVIWQRGVDGRWRMSYDGWTNPMEATTACRPPD
jgi:ketosteroid isomerase-like protein